MNRMSRGQRNYNTGTRSKLEDRVMEQLIKEGITYEYESMASRIRYTVPISEHIYTPDFVITTRSGKQLYLESKGIWDYQDRYKHLLIKQQYPELDIRFVFQRAKQRIRKGSKTTYRDICEGRGRGIFKGVTWQYSDGGKLPEEWFE